MAETETKWVLINKNVPLDPGDRVRMYYDIIGPTYMIASQVAVIEKKLESDPRFTLITTSLPAGDGWVKDIWFEILIKKPQQKGPVIQQASITGAVISVAIASAFAIASIFTWLSFREIKRMEIGPKEVKAVIKETGWTAMKIAAAAVVGFIALNWWKK